MEVFSLLKYWKGGGGGNAGVSTGCSSSSTASFATADDDDGGPFFDLEFDDEEDRKLERETEKIQEEEEDEDEQENGVVRSAEEMKPGPFKNPDSPIRTARKLRVLMLRLKRSKSESIAATTTSQTQNQNQNQHNNNKKKKLLTVKFEAEVPIISLLSRATSNSKVNTEQQAHVSCNEKRMNKREAVQKYLQMVKRVPKRHQAEHAAAMTAAIKRLNLRKSNSAVVPNKIASKRRDDSLLEQEDGIQSAILHCKRSFHASKGMYLRRSFSLSSIF